VAGQDSDILSDALPPERLHLGAVTISTQKLSNASRIRLKRQFLDGCLALGASPATSATVGIAGLVRLALGSGTLIVVHYNDF